jgi:hypothetical protein
VVTRERADRRAAAIRGRGADAGADEGRADQQHAHALLAFDLAAQAVEEAVQRMLARRIAGAADQRREAGDAGDGDDGAAPRQQMRKRGLRVRCTAPKKLTSMTRRITADRCRAAGCGG